MKKNVLTLMSVLILICEKGGTKICNIRKKAYLCTAIKAGSVAQLDRATPF